MKINRPTFEQLCYYYPHNVKIWINSPLTTQFSELAFLREAGDNIYVTTLDGRGSFISEAYPDQFRPALLPLNDFSSDEVLMEFFNEFGGGYKTYAGYKKVWKDFFIKATWKDLSVPVFQKCLSMNLDIFKMIDSGAAISNKIKLNKREDEN